jgi:hypothetical protein
MRFGRTATLYVDFLLNRITFHILEKQKMYTLQFSCCKNCMKLTIEIICSEGMEHIVGPTVGLSLCR